MKAAVGLVKKHHIIYIENFQRCRRLLAADFGSAIRQSACTTAIGDENHFDCAAVLPQQRQCAAAPQRFVIRVGSEHQNFSLFNGGQ